MSHLGALFNSDSDSEDLGWGPRFCIFNKLSGDTELGDAWTTPQTNYIRSPGPGAWVPREFLKIPKRISFAAKLKNAASLSLSHTQHMYVCVPYMYVCIHIYTYMYICTYVYINN